MNNLQNLISEQKKKLERKIGHDDFCKTVNYPNSSWDCNCYMKDNLAFLTTAITKGYELALEEVEKFVDARYQTVQATDDAHRFYQVKDKNEERTAVLDHIAHLKETK